MVVIAKFWSHSPIGFATAMVVVTKAHSFRNGSRYWRQKVIDFVMILVLVAKYLQGHFEPSRKQLTQKHIFLVVSVKYKNSWDPLT